LLLQMPRSSLLDRLLCLPALLLPPSAAVRAQTPPPLSSRDFSVAGIRDGMDSAAVRRRLGVPDSITLLDNPWKPPDKIAAWYYRDLRIALTDKVIGVMMYGPSVATRRGLRVGDTGKRVETLYGVPNPLDRSETEWWYRDPVSSATADHVILVELSNGVVQSIYVGWYTD